MSTINVIGAIEFRFSVTDFELAMKIQQLLKQNARSVVKPADARQASNGNGHTRGRGPSRDSTKEKYDKVLKVLQEKYGTKPFHAGDADADAAQLGYGPDVRKRALKAAIADGKVVSEKKGIYHFLESATTQPPAAEPDESSAAIPLPKSA